MRRLEEHCARLFIADTKSEETNIDFISIDREGSSQYIQTKQKPLFV